MDKGIKYICLLCGTEEVSVLQRLWHRWNFEKQEWYTSPDGDGDDVYCDNCDQTTIVKLESGDEWIDSIGMILEAYPDRWKRALWHDNSLSDRVWGKNLLEEFITADDDLTNEVIVDLLWREFGIKVGGE
jgi:hypothetical protein|tara:strand:+ start:69 stop:458 length:390 start_codon:yes stop_codon:yes gene_type:complete